MKKVSFLVGVVMGALLMFPAVVWSQCPNLNFGYGDLTYWQCYYGSCYNGNYLVIPSVQFLGNIDVMNRQQLIAAGKLSDENCSSIPKVPNGYNYSCRIGNSSAGAQVDGIEYEMTVDSMNSLLLVHFAWVLQNDGHFPISTRTQFNIQIRDSVGSVLNIPCGDLSFIATDTLQRAACYMFNHPEVFAKDWTTVGYSLESFMGQKIKIYLEARDCAQSGHWGYAYVVAECRPMRVEGVYCPGPTNDFCLKAPDGFASYTWTRSTDTVWRAHTYLIIPSNPQDGEIFTCTLHSETGCDSEIKIIIKRIGADVDFMFGVKNANGEVDFTTNNNQSWYDTCSRTATFVDMSKEHNSKKDKIKWEIPDLNVNNGDSIFTYIFPDPITAPKTYLVRLTVYTEDGCIGTFSQQITIYPSLQKDTAYAHFTTQEKTYCNNTNISFTKQSYGVASPFLPHLDCRADTNTYLTCTWYWGDGANSTQKVRNGENPIIEHKYSFLDNETKVVVRLVMEIDGLPAVGTFTYTDTLTIIRPMEVGFTSSEHYFPCIGQTGKEIFFTDASVSTSRITNYTWFFGDRHSNPDENIVQGEQMTNPSHLYRKAGRYDVMLAVEDEMGCVDTMYKRNYVFIDGPSGDYTVDTTSFCISHTVTFTPDIYKDPENANNYTVEELTWLFDGATPEPPKVGSAVALPAKKIYNQAGMYIPVMQMVKWVTNQETGQRERCLVILRKDTIWAIDLKPNFITESLYGLNEPVAFVNATEALPAELKCADSIHWDYGNGDELWLLKGETLKKDGATIYNAEGRYTVTLTEYYKTCHQSISRNIEVVKDLGVEQLRITDCELRIYPNPTTGQLRISLPNPSEGGAYDVYIQIYSVVGQMVYQINNLSNQQQISKSANNQINNITIDVSHLANGMYFLKITLEDGSQQVRRFVKE